MSTFFRYALLALCGAGGIAMACWIAQQAPLPTLAHRSAVAPVNEDDAAPPTVAEDAEPTDATPSESDSTIASSQQYASDFADSEPDSISSKDGEPRSESASESQAQLVLPIFDQSVRPATFVLPAIELEPVTEDRRPVAVQPTAAQEPAPNSAEASNNRRFEELLSQLQQATTALQPKPTAQADASSENDIDLLPPAEEKEPEPAKPPAPKPVIKRVPKKPIVSKVDAEGDNNLSIHIQDTNIREVLDLISEQGGLNILASSSVQGKVSASLSGVDIDTALAAILKSTGFTSRRDGRFIYVGTPQDFQNLNQLSDRIGTRIYRPNYVKASELQTLVAPLLTPQTGTASVTTPSEIGIAASTDEAGGNNFAGTDALLVRDYEAVLRQVDQVFEELDKRPLQVAIEAMILSVRINDKNSLGVDFEFLRNKENVVLATGSPLRDLGQVSFNNGGLKFGFLDSSLGAFVSALETIGDTNIIATPHLMCLNKHRAQILIGSRLGYVSTSVTETSTTQSVQFLEVGTQLRLRPFISGDGLIRMEVHPELSTGSVRIEQGFTLPDKEVTEVTTNIMVRDGGTLVIGGLMREELGATGNQVPLLGSAPWIGFLFRNRSETTDRREIIVLVTPHIVYDPYAYAEGEKAACEFHRRQLNYADHMSPIGTRYLGRKYFRIAQDAWAAGDRHAALKHVGLALSFDPLNRAALDLRGDIYANNHFGDHSGPVPAHSAMGPGALDGQQLAPWLLQDLQGQPCATDGPAYEEGVPGSVRPIHRPEAFE